MIAYEKVFVEAVRLFEEAYNLKCTCHTNRSNDDRCPQCDKIIEARNLYRPVIGDVAAP